MLDPIYTAFGVPATVWPASYGTPVTVTVIDKTSGVEVSNASMSEVSTIRPAALVRASEVATALIAREDLRRAELCMNGKKWRIESSTPKPTPNGESDGELMLLLIEVD
jgi:hypothetical protein